MCRTRVGRGGGGGYQFAKIKRMGGREGEEKRERERGKKG
jgi:hypothetical protein